MPVTKVFEMTPDDYIKMKKGPGKVFYEKKSSIDKFYIYLEDAETWEKLLRKYYAQKTHAEVTDLANGVRIQLTADSGETTSIEIRHAKSMMVVYGEETKKWEKDILPKLREKIAGGGKTNKLSLGGSKNAKGAEEENIVEEVEEEDEGPTPSIAALVNLGNTCFLNSVLQVLRYTPGFVDKVNQLVSDIKITKKDKRAVFDREKDKNTDIEEEVDTWTLMRNVSDVYSKMDKVETKYRSNHSNHITVKPSEVINKIEKMNPIFEAEMQQDAHELLRCMIAYIQDAVGEVNKFRKAHREEDTLTPKAEITELTDEKENVDINGTGDLKDANIDPVNSGETGKEKNEPDKTSTNSAEEKPIEQVPTIDDKPEPTQINEDKPVIQGGPIDGQKRSEKMEKEKQKESFPEEIATTSRKRTLSQTDMDKDSSHTSDSSVTGQEPLEKRCRGRSLDSASTTHGSQRKRLGVTGGLIHDKLSNGDSSSGDEHCNKLDTDGQKELKDVNIILDESLDCYRHVKKSKKTLGIPKHGPIVASVKNIDSYFIKYPQLCLERYDIPKKISEDGDRNVMESPKKSLPKESDRDLAEEPHSEMEILALQQSKPPNPSMDQSLEEETHVKNDTTASQVKIEPEEEMKSQAGPTNVANSAKEGLPMDEQEADDKVDSMEVLGGTQNENEKMEESENSKEELGLESMGSLLKDGRNAPVFQDDPKIEVIQPQIEENDEEDDEEEEEEESGTKKKKVPTATLR